MRGRPMTVGQTGNPPPPIRDAEMNTTNTMLAELEARRPGMSLDRKFYTDPEFHRLDLETLFYRDWLFAGHDCEIPAPGDYFTMQIGDYPIIVIRGRDGEIRALHNTCRHRGSRVCPAAKGAAKRLVCPYHQWTYDLDGSLIRARHQDGGIDKAQFGLKPVHCESAAGYIFICVAPVAPSFEPFRAQLARYAAPHRLADARIAFESTIVENGNWKLVWENNRECYHCAANHPELLRIVPRTADAFRHQRRARRRRDDGSLGALRGGGTAERVSAFGIGTIPRKPNSSPRQGGELHDVGKGRGQPPAE